MYIFSSSLLYRSLEYIFLYSSEASIVAAEKNAINYVTLRGKSKNIEITTHVALCSILLHMMRRNSF